MIQLPLFETHSDWIPPSHLPDLSDAKEIAIDTENRDPRLKTKGPGYVRADGHCAGFSLATDTGFSGYFPLAHEGGGNLDRGILCDWLRAIARRSHVDFIFASGQYDLGWLRTLGIEIGGPIRDICLADTLIDEERSDGYSLEAVSRRWTGQGKDERLLREAAQNWGVDPKADLWRLPPKLVGAYAETDALRTLQSWQKLKPVLRAEGLWEPFLLECELLPILFEMFWQGIRVDLDYAEQLNARWLKRERELLGSLHMSIDDIWNARALGRYFDKEGVKYRLTKEGEPSITKEWLQATRHPKVQFLQEVRALNRTRATYLEQNLIRDVINGRIHPQYVQMHSDDGGTRTMRLACKNPNAQQFPKRSTLFDAKSIRKVLIPEDGELWAKQDYWSQEPVIQCHYALVSKLPGADRVAEQFKKGVKLYTFIEEATKGRCNYDQAKSTALGRSYGMGKAKMSSELGLPEHECEQVLQAFDDIVPYIKMLASSVSGIAATRGFIRTLTGHKRHFDYWQVPMSLRKRNDDGTEPDWTPLKLDEAKRSWPDLPLERAWVYKAFNALIQGGAAGQTKKAIIDIKRALGLPKMTVHDEISKSVKDEHEATRMNEIMVNTIPLLAPVRADQEVGKSWC